MKKILLFCVFVFIGITSAFEPNNMPKTTVFDTVMDQCTTSADDIKRTTFASAVVGFCFGAIAFYVLRTADMEAHETVPYSVVPFIKQVGAGTLVGSFAGYMYYRDEKPELIARSVSRSDKKLLTIVLTEQGNERIKSIKKLYKDKSNYVALADSGFINLKVKLGDICQLLNTIEKYQTEEFFALKQEIYSTVEAIEVAHTELKQNYDWILYNVRSSSTGCVHAY